MAPIRTQWTRLIRFVAVETGEVHLGQPIDPKLDVGLAFHQKETIQVHEIVGSALDPTSALTENVLTVKELLAPLSREQVGLVRCMGLNYADHAAEANMQKPNAPVLFYKPATALISPTAPITVPLHAQPVEQHQPDWEAELTVVIGKAAKNVSEADALDYVLGYTVGNDISFRYHQLNISQWAYSKGFDNTSPFGPCIVAAHALPDPQTIRIGTVVNGQTMQDGSTARQLFTVRQSVAWFSKATTLLPGTLIMTGTPAGIGFTRKPPVILKNGDEVRTWADGGIGSCVNPVVEEKA